jgi:hypothetical protein
MPEKYPIDLDNEDIFALESYEYGAVEEIIEKIIDQAKKLGYTSESQKEWVLSSIIQDNSYDYIPIDRLSICKENQKILNMILKLLKLIKIEDQEVSNEYINLFGDLMIEVLSHVDLSQKDHTEFESNEDMEQYIIHMGQMLHNTLITDIHRKTNINWSNKLKQNEDFEF